MSPWPGLAFVALHASPHASACRRMQGTNWQASKFQLERRVAQLREQAEGEAAARKSVEAEKQAAQVHGHTAVPLQWTISCALKVAACQPVAQPAVACGPTGGGGAPRLQGGRAKRGGGEPARHRGAPGGVAGQRPGQRHQQRRGRGEERDGWVGGRAGGVPERAARAWAGGVCARACKPLLSPAVPARCVRPAEWLGMIAEARCERDAMAAAKAEAEHRADQLTRQLSAAVADLEAAKVGCLLFRPGLAHDSPDVQPNRGRPLAPGRALF